MANHGQTIKMTGAREAPRSARSRMDTLLLTERTVESWERPPFQRELRMTDRVIEAVQDLKENGGVISGVLTLGKLDGVTYLIDGQHRVAAFRESGLEEAIADVRICEFESMDEMAEEFMKLNSALVRMKNDDILRALESVNPNLAMLRRRCPFVGYGRVRIAGGNASRPNEAKVLLSAAVAIKTWFGSENTPTTGPASALAAKMMDADNTRAMSDFYLTCFEAWGGDKQNFRLWGTLNLAVLVWMYRRMVLGEHRKTGLAGGKTLALSREDFIKCLMAVSADARYIEWLAGRSLGNDRDKAPCFSRLKDCFARRLVEIGHPSRGFPTGDWQRG